MSIVQDVAAWVHARPAATTSAGQQSNEPPFDYDDDLPF